VHSGARSRFGRAEWWGGRLALLPGFHEARDPREDLKRQDTKAAKRVTVSLLWLFLPIRAMIMAWPRRRAPCCLPPASC
jgi:hypothetical protein